MSIDLSTRSSPVVDGRCTGCGRFIKGTESHFHSPPRKFRGPPKVHLFRWGEGGLVTRCDDVLAAHRLIVEKYARDEYGKSFPDLDDDDRHDVLRHFHPDNARVERGRVNVTDPEVGEGYSWWWMRLDDQAKGPGVTTAVVW